MMCRTIRSIAFTAAAVAVTAIPARSHAQKAPDADMQALASYRLTESTLHKVMQAGRNLAALAKDPAARAYMEKAQQEDQPEAKTIADMAKQFDGIPPMKKAITSAGLTSREYAMFTMSMLQASLAAAMMDAKGPYKLKELPKGTPPENVAFVRAHKAELEKYGAEMKALSGEANEGSDEEPAGAGTDSVTSRR
ncbi:MAG TPA: hypothetical protein VFS44_00740 [Gemmatimonadaceae bacterium]|nr:hypothetical protein [Gemmatimonadaceae bacterium]